MKLYAIHAPRTVEAVAGRRARARRATGFSFAALLFGPLWLLARGLWLALLVYVVAGRARRRAGALRRLICAGAAAALFALGHLYLARRGSRAGDRRRASARGRPLVDVVFADSALEAEKIYLERALGEPRRRRRAAARPARRPDVIGMFPEPRPMNVAIVDYGSGNLHSAHKAFERAAREAGLDGGGSRHRRSRAGRSRADRIVLPGVGAFADCRRGLDARRRHGRGAEESVAPARPAVPRHLRRHATAGRRAGSNMRSTAGLDWIPGDVAPIQPADPALKIPHMGWNTLDVRRPHPLLDGVQTAGLHAYFVHSYQLYRRRSRRRRRRRRLWRPDHRDGRRATMSPARSSIPRRARRSGWR